MRTIWLALVGVTEKKNLPHGIELLLLLLHTTLVRRMSSPSLLGQNFHFTPWHCLEFRYRLLATGSERASERVSKRYREEITGYASQINGSFLRLSPPHRPRHLAYLYLNQTETYRQQKRPEKPTIQTKQEIYAAEIDMRLLTDLDNSGSLTKHTQQSPPAPFVYIESIRGRSSVRSDSQQWDKLPSIRWLSSPLIFRLMCRSCIGICVCMQQRVSFTSFLSENK